MTTYARCLKQRSRWWSWTRSWPTSRGSSNSRTVRYGDFTCVISDIIIERIRDKKSELTELGTKQRQTQLIYRAIIERIGNKEREQIGKNEGQNKDKRLINRVLERIGDKDTKTGTRVTGLWEELKLKRREAREQIVTLLLKELGTKQRQTKEELTGLAKN